MTKKSFSFIFSILLLHFPLHAKHHLIRHVGEHIGWTSMYTLPQKTIDQHFFEVEKAVEYRWNLLVDAYDFPSYSPERDENSLVNEFYRFSNIRVQLWLENQTSFPCQSNPLFKISQAHLVNHRFRQPCCITFAHSATDPSYNSTSLSLGKRRFFALEGPLQEHVPYFFRLLTNWRVAYLVCLTNEIDASGAAKCYPYWNHHVVQNGQDQYLRITVDGAYEKSPSEWGYKDLPYLFWPDWEDHHGIDPKLLVAAVNQVRENTVEGQIIAVHCSAGVGRTGTFIAATYLLDKIDEQLEKGTHPNDVQINIAKLFLYLNFHRPWLVAKPSQYLTLYRTVEWYLDQKTKGEI